MSKIIFVGLHNKPGMKPLDIKTKSGKLIERIIDPLRHRGIKVVKTNLFDIDYYPKDKKLQSQLAFDWIERVELSQNDIIIVLGAATKEAFPPIPCTTIYIAHPASKRSHEEMNAYVEKTLQLINHE